MTTHVTWPAEHFYWSVLDAPPWKRSGPLPPGIAATLEDDLPVPIESVHAVGTPLGDGRLIACAVGRERLSEVNGDTVSLVPASIPPFIECAEGTAGRLNFLVGHFEPRSLVGRRTARHVLAAAAVLLIAGLTSVGLVRRTGVWEKAAFEAAAGRNAALSEADSPEALASEVARLNRLREASVQIQPPLDASGALAMLLTAWPASESSSPQSLAVNQSGISVSVSIDGDPTPFLTAFQAPAGWTLEEPRLNRADKMNRVSLHLKPRALSTGARTP